MVRKHAHLNADHLAEYANVVTFRSQQELEKKKPLARVAYLLDFTVYFGSPSWARTSDLRINSPALYRLSYWGPDVKKEY